MMFGLETNGADIEIRDRANPAPTPIRTICVFGGASDGGDQRLREQTSALGNAIGAQGLRLVYGGGGDGLMGVIAASAAEAGSEVISITPRFLVERMSAARGVQQTVEVPDMHMRKRLMFDYADAFVALPGGIGTVEELAEVLTWRKLERHRKPILVANFQNFWAPWLALLGHLEDSGFLSGHVTAACFVANDPHDILPMLQRGVCFSHEWPDTTGRMPSLAGAL